MPDQATGFVSVNGVQRMPIYTSTSNQSDSNYTYYVGDFTNGYAPLLNKSDNQSLPTVMSGSIKAVA